MHSHFLKKFIRETFYSSGCWLSINLIEVYLPWVLANASFDLKCEAENTELHSLTLHMNLGISAQFLEIVLMPK